MTPVAPPRDLVVSIVIGAVAGALWAWFGAGGLQGPAAVVVRAVALVTAVAILARTVQLLRTGAPAPAAGGPSMFASRPYRLIVALEVVAAVAGSAVLGATGLGAYVVAWIAIVVGVHFVGFGRFFHRRFYALGALLVLLGLAGIGTGLLSGSGAAVGAVTGIGVGAVFLAGTLAVVARARFGAGAVR